MIWYKLAALKILNQTFDHFLGEGEGGDEKLRQARIRLKKR